MYIKVTVKPKSKVEGVFERNSRYVVSVREPNENGEANRAAHALLAKHLRVLPKNLALVRGKDRPAKLFMLRE